MVTTSSLLPARPAGAALPDGLWAGELDQDPGPGRPGRTRRWAYVGAGSADVAVGAAIVDLGFASTGFAWCLLDGQVVTWEARGLPRIAARMGRHAATTSRFRAGGGQVTIGPLGDLDLDVPVTGGRLQVRVQVVPDRPAVCATPTPRGGWNTTQKVAGERARLRVRTPTAQLSTAGGAWRDWTLGAQDRQTSWRWAAAAGLADDGRRVGINASTGMNEAVGEDVVWWDGMPHTLRVTELGPATTRATGDWRVAGPGWSLDVDVAGVRAADENLLVVRSRYVQPIGMFRGMLPGPDGDTVPVTLVGVTEDHDARW